MTLAETVRQRILSDFEACGHNVSHTAKSLGVSRRAFYRLAYKHGILLPGNEDRVLPGTPEEKLEARLMVNKAISRGLPVLPCEVCHTTEDVEAHHADYSKPLAVRWLCKTHHVEAHNRGRSLVKSSASKVTHAFE